MPFDENFKAQRSLTRALNISPAALDLLIQTVSMKSVGNLTAFVRAHMLDSVDAAPRIATILEHWADLTRPYELVDTARQQLDMLELGDRLRPLEGLVGGGGSRRRGGVDEPVAPASRR